MLRQPISVFDVKYFSCYLSDSADDAERFLEQLAKEMEEVFPTYDLSGHRITTTLTHHRMLTEGCSIAFLKPDCEGSCSSCSGKKAKENCKRKKTSCKGSALDGLSFPFL